MIQYIIKIHNVKIKDVILMQLECFLFIYGSNCYVATVAYLASEDVVLGPGCVSVFILVSVKELSFRGC
jgi:hypothetical protein